jgi:hypothetical protein
MRIIVSALAIALLCACGDSKPSAGTQSAAAEGASGPSTPPGVSGAAAEHGAAAAAAGARAADEAGAAAASAAEAAGHATRAAADRMRAAGARASEAGAAAVEVGQEAADSAHAAADRAAEAGSRAVERAQAAAQAARAAASGSAAAVDGEPPADFPVPIPAGVKGTFVDRTADGTRERAGTFRYTGSIDEFAATCEKAVRARGLEPLVQKQEVSGSQVVEITATKGDTEIAIAIMGKKGGASMVSIAWTEPAP